MLDGLRELCCFLVQPCAIYLECALIVLYKVQCSRNRIGSQLPVVLLALFLHSVRRLINSLIWCFNCIGFTIMLRYPRFGSANKVNLHTPPGISRSLILCNGFRFLDRSSSPPEEFTWNGGWNGKDSEYSLSRWICMQSH